MRREELFGSSLKNKNEIQRCVRPCWELSLTRGHFRTLRGGLSRFHYFIRCSGLWGCVSSVNPLHSAVETIHQSLLWDLLSLWCHFLEYRQVLHIPEMRTTKARSLCTSVVEIMLSMFTTTANVFIKIRKHNYILASSLSASFQHVSQDVMTSSRTYNMTSDRRGKSKLPVVKRMNILALIVFILDQFEQDRVDSVPHRHFGAILWHRRPFFHPTSCDMMTSLRTYNAIRQKMKV